MNPLRVLIIDDEKPARDRLRELLRDCSPDFPNVVAGEAANGIEGIEWLSAHRADIALVDIHMPAMSGIEFARHAQGAQPPPAVIFVTAHDQYAVAAFEVNAIDYLLKPVRAARLLAALRKASGGTRAAREVLERLEEKPRRYFSVAERNRVTLVPVGDALFLRAGQKYVTLRTMTGEHLIDESLTSLEREFAGVFVRVHRNCLAARARIRGIERVAAETPGEDADPGWALVIEGSDERLPVSRRQWPQVKALVKG